MSRAQRIICTVTNDLNYDQRMIRICTALTGAGYDVTLIGFERKTSKPLIERPFKQVRIPIIAEQGKIMYLHYWIKLFFLLLRTKADTICAIDLDTILPVYYASLIKGTNRVYDAHEIFTELREVITRPSVYRMWQWIGNHTVPHFKAGYTIGECYADYFKEKYGVSYGVVRNATILKPVTIPEKPERFILYQGAVNVGRCFEQLIPAMKLVNARLLIIGDGNFMKEAQQLTLQHGLQEKVIFEGYIPPAELRDYTLKAWVGITLFEDTSLSNRLSMANRFFDYMHNGVPQLCVRYPEYIKVNERYEIATLVETVTPECIAEALNRLLTDEQYYSKLQQNSLKARDEYCWQEQEKTLLSVYKQFDAK